MLRSAVLLCAVAAALAFDVSLDTYWESFKVRYNKQYSDQVEPVRRVIWERNLAFIREHNLQADMGMHTYTLGINEYADWTNEEYVQYLKGYNRSNATRSGSLFIAPSNVEVPDEVDWRTMGYVTPVKDQHHCGACWAFSATGSLEGQHFRNTYKLVSLSEQNLVDCSRKQGKLGCDGGTVEDAFTYIRDNNGIDTESSYPYEGEDCQCRFKASDVGATVRGFTYIPIGDEDALKTATATVGPISVAIDASGQCFQFYTGGIFNNPRCRSTEPELNHYVLVVGYGTQSNTDYWLVKNSWGKGWGMKGYIMMSRNKNNQCGIASEASYPLV